MYNTISTYIPYNITIHIYILKQPYMKTKTQKKKKNIGKEKLRKNV
jgi:hypothetical protein